MKTNQEKQKIQIDKIVKEKIRLMQYHFSRLMLQMVNEINKVTMKK